jgi:tRNA(adenine34) deaminase
MTFNNFDTQEQKDLFFMNEALKEAKKALKEKEVPVGAVLVFENRIVARGHNQVELLRDATAHAEMICLTSGAEFFHNWRLLDTTLYCTLEPCLMCSGAILNARVKRVVYGADDMRVGANGSWINVFEKKHPMHEVEIEGGILKEESSYLLKTFFQNKRKKESLLSGIIQ